MMTKNDSLRALGVVWLLLAPILFVMASISTVRSDAFYHVQLAVFSLVGLVAGFFGVTAVCRVRWAAVGLWALSWLGAIYFLGSAFLLLIGPLIPGSKAQFFAMGILLVLVIAAQGVPFLLMARALRRIIRSQGTGAPKNDGSAGEAGLTTP